MRAAQPVELVVFRLVFGADDAAHINRGDGESNQRRRYVQVVVAAAHAVFAANGGAAEGGEGVMRAEQRGVGLSPVVRLCAHAAEVFLQGVVRGFGVAAAGDEAGGGVHHREQAAVVGRPGADGGVVAVREDGGGVGSAFGRQLVNAGFCRGALVAASVGDEDAGGADAVIEAVAEAFLVGMGEGGELCFEGVHPVFFAGDC